MADHDDGSILDDAQLLRRVHPSQVIEDKNLNRTRPSSGAFDAKDLSVHSQPLLLENGLDWRFCLRDHPGYSLASFTAGFARGRNLPVLHKPLEGDAAHCEVHGNKTPSIQKALYRESIWVHLETRAA